MILVAGGTGALGTVLVKRLRARFATVRVLVRDPARAVHLRDSGVELVKGDLRDSDSLRRAVTGVDTVVAAAHGFGNDDSGSPDSVDRHGNMHLVEAAAGAGAHLVLMSAVAAASSSRLDLFRAKHDAEQYLKASTAPWSIVRATAFVETWAGIMGPIVRTKGRTLVFGRGDNPINFVSVIDVAALVDRVVMDSSLRQHTFEIGGPDNISFNQFAAMVGERLGKPGPARHVPRAVLRGMATLLGPFKPSLARHAQAALLMDLDDMSFDDSLVRRRFVDLPSTPVRAALDAYFSR